MQTASSPVFASYSHSRTMFTLLLSSTVFAVLMSSTLASAGVCWEDRCKELLQVGLSKEDCCASGSPTASWTPSFPRNGQILFWRLKMSRDIARQCQPCRETCDNVRCPEGKRCRMRNGRPRCICAPVCHQHRGRHSHVCGNDGNEYRSHCALARHNCRFNRIVSVDYFSRCQRSCDTVECPENKYCVKDQNGLPHCLECQACPQGALSGGSQQSWCGSDGKTYHSMCALRYAGCTMGGSVVLAYPGVCRESATCDGLLCSDRKQQCLVDLRTGRPRCVSCTLSCRSSARNIDICGTDGNTYPSWCAMQNASCRRGVYIETKHSGRCLGNTGRNVGEND